MINTHFAPGKKILDIFLRFKNIFVKLKQEVESVKPLFFLLLENDKRYAATTGDDYPPLGNMGIPHM